MLLLVELQTLACNITKLLKVAFLQRWFSRFLNCANGTEPRKASQMLLNVTE